MRQIERLDTVARANRLVAMGLEKIVEELHIELVVLHDQDRLRPDSALGALAEGRDLGDLGHFSSHDIAAPGFARPGRSCQTLSPESDRRLNKLTRHR